MVHPYLRRRSGIEPEIYPSPDPAHGDRDELRRILAKTKGVPLFQEQAMRIAMTAARFSDAEVNELRKAMATFRRRGTIGLLEEKMISRMVGRGYAPAFAERCFNQIKGFGEYGFPESHAASFAHLVYVSAWLKCHYPAAFCAAILNAQPMGFYAPAQLVRDAREHGVQVREVDVNLSDWDSTLEQGEEGGGPGSFACPSVAHPQPGVRLGLRQIDGLAEAEVMRLVAARTGPAAVLLSGVREKRGGGGAPRAGCGAAAPLAQQGFHDLYDLRHRAGIRLDTIERLAAADAFRSIGLERRQALWEAKALADGGPLPLFAWSEARETGAEAAVVLPAMPLSEHVVNDYQTLRLSLKAHPMSFLRDALRAERVLACADLARLRDGARAVVAGVILVRQRPGSAKGVVFMTIEDETGIANAVVWPRTLERYRRVVMGARLVLIRGRVQRHQDIIHVVAGALEDRSELLSTLVEGRHDPMPLPIANADEVLRPDPGSARTEGHMHHPRFGERPKPGHPRDQRVLPKSRDFH